jgi:DNA-binding transcriptional LysR family regulator
MEMHQVRYFLAMAAELNFTRAAEKCHVAQPSLTRAIQLLEEELGGELFHRERANTRLTELGHMVKPHLEQVWGEAQATKQLAVGFRNRTRAKLKFGIMCTIAPNQLVELFVNLQARHPSIELEIIDSSAKDLHERLLAGELEVAIYCNTGKLSEDKTHLMPLFREQMMIVLRKGHPLANRNAICVRELEGLHYLKRVDCEFIGIMGPEREAQGVFNDTIYQCTRDDWIMAMAAAGLGYAFMPRSSISHPDVVALPLIEPEFWREVNLATVRGRRHSPALGAFVREVMQAHWLGKAAIAVERAAHEDLSARDPA